jgi:homogentisate 1,2-dioxygenase
VPTAFYENTEEEFTIINKYLGKFYTCTKKGSPYDVVGWHGNYYPYKYNLDLFNAMSSVTFDHPDPSIFTVITC